MLLKKDTDLSEYLAGCRRQAEFARLRARASVDPQAGLDYDLIQAEMQAIFNASHAALARALGLRVSRLTAHICELREGRFGHEPCPRDWIRLRHHSITLVSPNRPRRPVAIVTHPYFPPDEIIRLARQEGLHAEVLALSAWNPTRPHGTTGAILTVDRGVR
jgi:hypothetical protein